MQKELLFAALARMGLMQSGDTPEVIALTGGVSSDIVRVALPGRVLCVKQALPKLKVTADWQAPVERSRFEMNWLQTVASILPDAVPQVLGEDVEAGMFAMQFLDPVEYPVWKEQLRDGNISLATAVEVGRRMGAIHRATAGDARIAAMFATDHIFFPIRLEPYLSATAAKHPDCANRLQSLVRITGASKKALVHGDISPKNILAGPRGPVFLDAECAWYGDPAFDLAFCLNHLLLKCASRPQWQTRYLECYDALANAYLASVNWESPADIECRTAHLLPGLLLGRIDGRSPVEYLTQEGEREAVRHVARSLLLEPVATLAAIRHQWVTQRKAMDRNPA